MLESIGSARVGDTHVYLTSLYHWTELRQQLLKSVG